MNRLERYVLARTLGGIAAALTVITAVILLIQFVELSRTMGVRVDRSLWADQALKRRKISEPLVPPKPKEFESATSIFMGRAVLGT